MVSFLLSSVTDYDLALAMAIAVGTCILLWPILKLIRRIYTETFRERIEFFAGLLALGVIFACRLMPWLSYKPPTHQTAPRISLTARAAAMIISLMRGAAAIIISLMARAAIMIIFLIVMLHKPLILYPVLLILLCYTGYTWNLFNTASISYILVLNVNTEEPVDCSWVGLPCVVAAGPLCVLDVECCYVKLTESVYWTYNCSANLALIALPFVLATAIVVFVHLYFWEIPKTAPTATGGRLLAAVSMQRQSFLQSKRAAVRGQAAIMVQRLYRAHAKRLHVQAVRPLTIMMQRLCRGHVQRQSFLRSKRAAVLMQSHFRGRQARLHVRAAQAAITFPQRRITAPIENFNNASSLQAPIRVAETSTPLSGVLLPHPRSPPRQKHGVRARLIPNEDSEGGFYLMVLPRPERKRIIVPHEDGMPCPPSLGSFESCKSLSLVRGTPLPPCKPPRPTWRRCFILFAAVAHATTCYYLAYALHERGQYTPLIV